VLGGREEMHTKFWFQILVERGGSENIRRRKYTIKMDLETLELEGAGAVRVAEDSDRWRAVVNTVMNIQVP
jgi:hypothetical protein